MTVVLNTLTDNTVADKFMEILGKENEVVERFDTEGMKISHCMGCNYCFLKTPGECVMKDDFVQILKQLVHSDKLWLIADTRFGFVDSKGKKVMDRIIPMLNMTLEFREGIMRHQLRYGALSVGLIYTGEGNSELLDFWCRRASGNLGGCSLGAHPVEKIEEVKA